jgi:hypothetical protein
LHKLLLEALDLNLLRFILQDLKLLMVVQQVVELATVNFVHRDRHSEIPLMILKVSNASIKEIPDG